MIENNQSIENIGAPENIISTKCRICGHSGSNPKYVFKERMFGMPDMFDYFQCEFCQCLQIKNYPNDMARYYPESDYYSYLAKLPKVRRGRLKDVLRITRNRYAIEGRGIVGRILARIKPFDDYCPDFIRKMKLPLSSRILDVGCGHGLMLCELSDLGFKQLEGVDPFIPKSLRYDHGVVIHKAKFYDMQGAYDFIMFNHSLEHMADQLQVLRHVHKLLNKYGLCVLRVPTVSSYAWEHYGKDWIHLEAPRHFYLHSKESIRCVAGEAGFKIDDIRCDAISRQFWGSERYLRNQAWNTPDFENSDALNKYFGDKKMEEYQEMTNRLNQITRGDFIQVYLRK